MRMLWWYVGYHSGADFVNEYTYNGEPTAGRRHITGLKIEKTKLSDWPDGDVCVGCNNNSIQQVLWAGGL